VTAKLCVDYIKPTPLGVKLKLIGRISEIKGRKVTVKTELFAGDEICARGEAIVVRIPDDFLKSKN